MVGFLVRTHHHSPPRCCSGPYVSRERSTRSRTEWVWRRREATERKYSSSHCGHEAEVRAWDGLKRSVWHLLSSDCTSNTPQGHWCIMGSGFNRLHHVVYFPNKHHTEEQRPRCMMVRNTKPEIKQTRERIIRGGRGFKGQKWRPVHIYKVFLNVTFI